MTGVRWRLLSVLLLAGAALVALTALGRGSMRTPPTTSWPAVEAWYEAVGPGAAAMAAVRGVALIGSAWVLLAATLQLLSTLPVSSSLNRLADALSPALLRPVVRGAAHLSIAAGLGVPPPTDAPPIDPPGTAVMEVLPEQSDDAGTTTTTTTVGTTVVPTTTIPPATTTTRPVDPPDPPRRPPAPPPAPEVSEPAPDELVVEPGDSFWRIAADVLRDARRREVTDREVHDYWQRLIDANTSRLVDPGNPDLILPSQRLVVPRP